MTELNAVVPENIQKHLQYVAKSFGLDEDQETIDALAHSWTEKLSAFEEKMIDMGMDELGSFEKNDERAALVLTYSGSLLSLGPKSEDGRNIEYTSIGLRKDVPASIVESNCILKDDIAVEKGVEFEKGPIQHTSPAFKIVACPDSLSPEEQDEMISEATTIIVDAFVDLNNDLL